MLKTLRNERGFTLIEMLAVLAIFMIISASLMFFISEKLIKYTNTQVIDQTELLIRMGQVRAIYRAEAYEFYAVTCREVIVRNRVKTEEILYRGKLPDDMKIFVSTPNKRITFLVSGSISQAGGIVYFTKDSYYRFTLNIGKGRVIAKDVKPLPEGTESC